MVCFDPQGTKLLDANPTYRESFQCMGCLRFCENLEGYHKQVANEFVLNFDGRKIKVGPLDLEVSDNSIAVATKIPRLGEKWFKLEKVELTNCNDFVKNEQKGANLTYGIPRA